MLNSSTTASTPWLAGGVALGAALAASLAATPLVRAWARRTGKVARPRADRWHSTPTALLGGIAIFIAFVVGSLLGGRFGGAQLFTPRALLLLGCATAAFVLGLVDDLVNLRPYAKLIAQIAIVTAWTTWGERLSWFQQPVLQQLVTIFWLVGITNALNLLDNMDGLAGGIAAVTAAFLLYFLGLSGHGDLVVLVAALLGAVLGFLVYNFNPASIFMGDSGSLFLGLFLGAAALGSDNGRSRNLLAILTVPVFLLLIPILDTTIVTLSRKLAGRPVSQGGRDHTSHRLVALGLSERAAVGALYLLAAGGGFAAIALSSLTPWVGLSLLVPVVLAVLFVGIFLARVHVYEPVEDLGKVKGRALLPTLAEFTYKRRIFEVLHDAVVIVAAYWSAFLLRFEGQLTEPYYHRFLASLPLVLVTQLGVFLAAGVYRGLWRYTGMDDLVTIVRAVVGAVAATGLAIVFVMRFEGFSRAVLVIDLALLLLFVTAARVSFRVLRTWLMNRAQRSGRRVLIYGAGDGGELALREMRNNQQLGLVPVGFIDDDPLKAGKIIHGVPVLGNSEQLPLFVEQHRVAEVVVSTQHLSAARWSLLRDQCRSSAVECRQVRIAIE